MEVGLARRLVRLQEEPTDLEAEDLRVYRRIRRLIRRQARASRLRRRECRALLLMVAADLAALAAGAPGWAFWQRDGARPRPHEVLARLAVSPRERDRAVRLRVRVVEAVVAKLDVRFPQLALYAVIAEALGLSTYTEGNLPPEPPDELLRSVDSARPREASSRAGHPTMNNTEEPQSAMQT